MKKIISAHLIVFFVISFVNVVLSAEEPLPERRPEKNRYNRYKYAERRHPQLKYDEYGQIDPSPDRIAIEHLPRDGFGFVDWSTALKDGFIVPRDSVMADGEEVTVVYSDRIVIKPRKDFMPDVIFPHGAHNLWLNCSNCHPDIFAMKTGASGMSMTGIWKGEFCGRCHDRVAFPIRNCFRCHSGPKKW